MTLTFYMDEHIHRAITTGLRRRGVDVLTVQEDGLSGSPDQIILERATELQRLLFSQDEDFLIEATRRQQQGVAFSGVIYSRQLLVPIGDCIRDLEIISKVGQIEEFANLIQYLPL